MRENLIEDLKQIQSNTVSSVIQRQDKLESYLDEVHSMQLKESEKNKVVQIDFLKSIKNTDAKMEVVCNIEKNH